MLPDSEIITTLRDPTLYDRLRFPMLVLYKHPKDFPAKYAIRVWDMVTPQRHVMVFDALEDALRAIPPRFVRLEREANDDPCIIATFI